MDFISCVKEGLTLFWLIIGMAGLATVFISYDVWLNRKANDIMITSDGAQMIDHGDLLKLREVGL